MIFGPHPAVEVDDEGCGIDAGDLLSEIHEPTEDEIAGHFASLSRIWMIEELTPWTLSRNRLRRLAMSPVHQLADPALGALVETLVTLSLRTYAQANEARVHHLGTRAGEHEIDLIIERGDGRIVALEVNLSATVNDNDTRHLRWLANSIGDDLLDSAIVTTGKSAYRRPDGIAVIREAPARQQRWELAETLNRIRDE